MSAKRRPGAAVFLLCVIVPDASAGAADSTVENARKARKMASDLMLRAY
jgi:hypothetical protein